MKTSSNLVTVSNGANELYSSRGTLKIKTMCKTLNHVFSVLTNVTPQMISFSSIPSSELHRILAKAEALPIWLIASSWLFQNYNEMLGQYMCSIVRMIHNRTNGFREKNWLTENGPKSRRFHVSSSTNRSRGPWLFRHNPNCPHFWHVNSGTDYWTAWFGLSWISVKETDELEMK